MSSQIIQPSSPVRGSKAAAPSPVFSPSAAPLGGVEFDQFALGGPESWPECMSDEMHAAVTAGDAEAVAALLANKENVEARTKFGESSLHRAVRGGAAGVVDVLLGAGAEIDGRDEFGKTALMTLCGTRSRKYGKDHLECAGKLLAAGADPTATDLKQGTALARAAREGHTTIAASLLKAGALPDSKDTSGRTPLLQAAGGGSGNVIKLLLKTDAMAKYRKHAVAKVNTTDATKKSALMLAAASKNLEGVTALLLAGADPFLEDEDGKLAVNYCRKCKDVEEKIQGAMARGNGGGKKKKK